MECKIWWLIPILINFYENPVQYKPKYMVQKAEPNKTKVLLWVACNAIHKPIYKIVILPPEKRGMQVPEYKEVLDYFFGELARRGTDLKSIYYQQDGASWVGLQKDGASWVNQNFRWIKIFGESEFRGFIKNPQKAILLVRP